MSTRDIAEVRRSYSEAVGSASRLHNVLSRLALFVLCAIAVLAFAPTVQPTLADRVTLFLLAIAAGVCFCSPALRYFVERADAATFAVTLAMFVIYGLARQGGPENGWSLTITLLPDTPLVVPYAARVALIGAVVTTPLWWRNRNDWTRALLAAMAIVVVLGTGIFWFLGRYYTVGETEVLDPTPLVQVLMQSVEYIAVTLLCSAACALPGTRRLLLRILPMVLLALWARYQFFAVPTVEEAE